MIDTQKLSCDLRELLGITGQHTIEFVLFYYINQLKIDKSVETIKTMASSFFSPFSFFEIINLKN